MGGRRRGVRVVGESGKGLEGNEEARCVSSKTDTQQWEGEEHE